MKEGVRNYGPSYIYYNYIPSNWIRPPGACTGGGNCSPGSSRLDRLGASQAQKAKVSGDESPRLRALQRVPPTQARSHQLILQVKRPVSISIGLSGKHILHDMGQVQIQNLLVQNYMVNIRQAGCYWGTRETMFFTVTGAMGGFIVGTCKSIDGPPHLLIYFTFGAPSR